MPTSPDGNPAKKLAYIARHWDGLQIFLAVRTASPLDSNSVENLVRPIALTRSKRDSS